MKSEYHIQVILECIQSAFFSNTCAVSGKFMIFWILAKKIDFRRQGSNLNSKKWPDLDLIALTTWPACHAYQMQKN